MVGLVRRVVRPLSIAYAAGLLVALALCPTAFADTPPAPAPSGGSSSVAPTPDPAICAQVEQWTSSGYPQRAVALADGVPGTCALLRSDAVARVAKAERDALLAPRASDGPAKKYASPDPQPTCVDQAPVELVAAWNCDRENAQVVARIAALEPATPAGTISRRWSAWSEDNLAPLSTVLLAFVVWVAAAIVVVRFLPLLLRNAGIRAASTDERRRRRFELGGLALVLLGAGAGTFGVAGLRTDLLAVEILGVAALIIAAGYLALVRNIPIAIRACAVLIMVLGVWMALPSVTAGAQLGLFALALTLAGVVAWDVARRSSQRMRVTVDEKDTETNAAKLRGTISELGASGARGIELPRGPDTDVLQDIDLGSLTSGSWSKIVSSVLLIFKPYAPWSLRVEMAGPAAVTFSLDRNGQGQGAGYFDTASVPVPKPASGAAAPATQKDQPLDPMVAPAAFATVRVATDHGRAHELSGAKVWRSVALQYHAATRHDPYDSVSRELLARAVTADPGNRAARFSLLLSTYRQSTEPAQLRVLVSALRALIAEITTDEAQSALLLRARYCLVATLVNQVFAGGTVRQSAGVAEDYGALLTLCRDLGEEPDDPAYRLARSSLPAVLHLWATVNRIEVVEKPEDLASDAWPGSPSAAYAEACGLMPLVGPPERPKEIVRLLQIADALPTNAQWRQEDPQLKGLRSLPAYREQFGDAVESDFLTLEPYATHRRTLEALDLRDAQALADLDVELLRGNGVPAAVARRMKDVARLGCRVSGGLVPWRVPIVGLLLARGIVEADEVSTDLVDDLTECLLRLRPPTATTLPPSRAQVLRWLRTFPSRHVERREPPRRRRLTGSRALVRSPR